MPDRSSRNLSHDKIFKTLFRLFLADLVDLLERGIAASFDLSSVVFPSSEAFSEMKKGGHLDPDFVARSARRDRPGFLVLHAETEARFRRATEARMWRYFTHLSAQFGDAVVLPLVVFLKGGPPNLRQIELDRGVGSFAPVTFRYLSFGLSGSLAEDWLAKPQTLVAALAACMRSKAWDRVEQKLQCMRRALGEKDPARQYLLTRVVENYLQLEGEERDRYEAAFAKEKASMVPFPLTFEEALEESEARGEVRGEARGEIRGELRATCEAILRLVERRFGQIPAAFASQLAAISEPGRLRSIFDRALEAQSFDQLEASLG